MNGMFSRKHRLPGWESKPIITAKATEPSFIATVMAMFKHDLA